jgi:hypothetical protein
VDLDGFGFVRVTDDEGQVDGGVFFRGGEGGELGRGRVPFGFARVGADLDGELG